jgi:hypothetical protein
MRVLLVSLLLTLSGAGWSQTNGDLPEMCAATYMYQRDEEKLLRWQAMFRLRGELVTELYTTLKTYEEEGNLPASLVQEAIAECDRVYEFVSSLQEGND